MEIDKAVSALNSKTRREALKILANEPKTVKEVLSALREKGYAIKYRETVYRILERLVDASLVEKYYDREKGICYKLLTKELTLDLIKGSIKPTSNIAS